MSFTVKELEEKLDEACDQNEIYWGEPFELKIDGIGTVKGDDMEIAGAGEDRNDATQIITVGDRYFKKNGFYDSWNGTEWDGDFEEVKPVKVEYTEYHPL